MRISLLLSGVVVLLACRPAMAQAQVDSARLRGAVVDEANRPVAGARVTLVREAQAVGGARRKWRNAPAPAVSQAVSDLAGNFLLTRLSPARYDVCIEAPGYLTTCEWEQWASATVAAGAVVDRGALRLTRAALVTIRLEDPSGLLRSVSRLSFPLLGVRDRFGRIHAARKAATEGSTHTFHVEVPYETQLAVRVHSARYQLRDAQSRASGCMAEIHLFRSAVDPLRPRLPS